MYNQPLNLNLHFKLREWLSVLYYHNWLYNLFWKIYQKHKLSKKGSYTQVVHPAWNM